MKTLILYTTKHGSTQEIAQAIAQKLSDAQICNLKKESAPPLAGFDCVVLGSPLTAGQISKNIKEFVQHNSGALQKKRLGFFVSGLDATQEATYLENNFPTELLETAKAKRFLGGVYDPAKCGFLERMVMKAAAKQTAYTSKINPDRINLFVKELNA